MSIPCVYIKPLEIDGKVVSSQRIRKTLMQGHVPGFKLLGRTYSLSGRVAHGKKTGSSGPDRQSYFDENRQLPKFGICFQSGGERQGYQG